MKTIVYQSNAGHTKKYAELLSKETGIPHYSVNEAKVKVPSGSDIIFMGWLMAGNIISFNKTKKRYNIKAVCAVGMSGMESTEKIVSDTVVKYRIPSDRIFYLQGGLESYKLKGIYKLMAKAMENSIAKLEHKQVKSFEEIEMENLIKSGGGGDCVSKENLQKVINWCKKEEHK